MNKEISMTTPKCVPVYLIYFLRIKGVLDCSIVHFLDATCKTTWEDNANNL